MVKQETKVMRLMSTEDGDCCEILVYGRIGEGWYYDETRNNEQMSFVRMMDDAAKKYKEIKVRLNSPGGEVVHADGMSRVIRKHADKISLYADGIVASCAMDLFLAVPKMQRFAAKNAKFMVHCSSSMVFGTAADMEEAAKVLRVFDRALAETMADNIGKTPEEVESLYLDGKDHWFTASQALADGFVGAIESYEAENVPAEAEKMNIEQLAKYYVERESEPTKATKPNIIEKMTQILRGTAPATPSVQAEEIVEKIIDSQNEDEIMTSETLVTAIREGKLLLSEVEQIVNAEKAKQPITREDADGLVKKIAALEAKIERMAPVNAGNGAPQAAGVDPVVDTTADPDAAIMREGGSVLAAFVR